MVHRLEALSRVPYRKGHLAHRMVLRLEAPSRVPDRRGHSVGRKEVLLFALALLIYPHSKVHLASRKELLFDLH